MSKDRFEVKETIFGKERDTLGLTTEIIIDKETGVNYLFVHRGQGGGLTPLIDAEGKPIVTKDGYKK